MNNRKKIFNLCLSAMFLALAFVLPFFTGQIPQIGSKLCPMHLPVILCGYACSGVWGLVVGFIAPLLRCFIVGMPSPLFPKAIAMAFELAAYGFMAGTLYRVMPKKKVNIYASLVISMVVGRFVWGAVQLCCAGLDATKFTLSAFWAGAVVNAVPGIIIQLVLIPVLVVAMEKLRAELDK
ncbi:MAG: ECF transporter S component [Clostridia bacterium]|nr:ECF transporter S component [Clostridia bacterium]